MDKINQTLLTIFEANRLAAAKNPHAHRLALILLDNLAEVALRRKSELEFDFDRTNWISGVRKYSKKKRSQIRRFHNHLLDLAIEKEWITAQDAHILAFAHKLRNTTYHEGNSDDPIELDIGLTLLFRFLIKYLPKWRSSGLIMLSPHEPISIDNAIQDQTGCAPLVIPASLLQYNVLSSGMDKEAAWLTNLQYCVTFDYDRDIRPAIKRRIENMLDDVADHIHFLTKYDDTDFNPVLAHRFSKFTPVFNDEEIAGKKLNDPVIALNIYLAVLDEEEDLLDIEDFAIRAAKFHQLLNAHNYDKMCSMI